MEALFVVVSLLLSGCSCQQASELLVQLDTGLVQGYVRSAEHSNYTSYRGIPYAQQPVGTLRFQPLQPLEPWEGTYDALNEGPICPQIDTLGPLSTSTSMSEECMFVNVHVPEGANSSSGLPVLVFVYGGEYSGGSGDSDIYGPEYLVEKGIIVVTFNYRVGALGFLSLGTKELPGNLGMRDMVEALKWVRRNIAAFGGDPDNVTLTGQSAGATSVHLLLVSNMTQGLFQRAIMMSGIATRSWLTLSSENAAELANKLIQKLGINSTDPEYVVEALQAINASDIVNAATEIQKDDPVTTFYPVIENTFDGVEAFLSEDPDVIIESGKFEDIPIIIGFTDNECGSYESQFTAFGLMERLKTRPELLLPASLQYDSNSTRFADRISKLKTRYFGTADFTNDTLDTYLTSATDSWFIYPALYFANLYSQFATSDVYVYQFSFVGDYHPFQDLIPSNFTGAYHAQDLTYVFKLNSYESISNITAGSEDDSIREFMTSSFVNFTQYSNPAPNCDDWPSFRTAEQNININHTVTIQQNAYEDIIQFYDDVFEN